MALQVWLPLTKDLRNQGLADVTVTNNGATFDSAGKLGGCYYFNGSSKMFLPSFSTTRSIAFWLKCPKTNTTIAFVDYQSKLGFGFQSSGYIIPNCGSSSDARKMYSPENFIANEWNHIVLIRDDNFTDVVLYINGELQTNRSGNNQWDNSVDGCFIGGRSQGTHMTCSINDFRVYDHALSPMEVKQLSQGLVLHYPLDNNGWGQENLLKNSTFLQQSTSWNRNGTPFSTDYSFNGRCVGTLTPSSGATSRQNMSQYITTMFADLNNLSMVTCSFWYKAEVGANTNGVGVMLRIANSNSQYNDVIVPSGLTVDGAWHYKMYTVDLSRFNNTNITSVSFLIFCQGAPVSYSMLKLELGSIATPWCPNSSDELATTIGMNDGIEYDCSGFGNNGIRAGEFSWSSDTPRYLSSMIFEDDCSQYIHTNHFSNLTQNITMSCWVYQTSATATSGGSSTSALFIMSQGRDYNKWGFGIRTMSGVPNLYITTTSNYQLNSNVNILNGWHHLVATYDGLNAKIYVDGILKATQSISGDINYIYDSEKLVIGKMSYGYTGTTTWFPFVGNISDVRVYATAISAEDILSLYQASAYIDSQGNTFASSYVEG